MADTQTGPLLPNVAGSASPSKNERTPSAAHNTQKRNQRHRMPQLQSTPQVDGTVSDSVTNPMASPRSKKAPKQREQSVATGALPNPSGNMGTGNGQRPRPVSLGGSMLPATPLKEQAYAGPTFQASPAPSSLPVPKFFSRSVPNVAAQQSLEARMAGEKTPEKEQSSPEPDVISPSRPSRAAQQSPLDIFFKADMAEKEKSRSGSTLSPEMAASLVAPATEPRNPFQQSGSSVFLRDLDGDDKAMPSPKTVPHSSEKPSAQRGSSSPGIRVSEADGEVERETATRSLKDLLFNNVNGSPAQNMTPPQPQQRAHSNPRATGSPFETPSPFQRPASGPSTPTPSAEQQNHYSLHYGNRNLSPLFKAARNETPSRPSGLRQNELANDTASNSDSAVSIPPQPRQLPQIDPDSFSRSYLNQQKCNSQSPTLPPLPRANGVPPPPSSSSFSGASSVPQHGVPVGNTATSSASGATPRTGSAAAGGGSNDIRTMENDLKRMLNLNVLSN